MAKREVLNYDAFISYRHSELDSFVAENIHRELEKFTLPKNLTKKEGEFKKTKIERVFRDRDELPIAADLSQNITEALDKSEFLIIICSPRLKDSIWCKNEMDTFIAKNGRSKVLAVLAEGEPRESFPPQITRDKRIVKDENGNETEEWYDVEPLAADVRGENHKEIKKKIKEEVLRLAAAMLECNYDEIKQRHREQLLRRRAQIASVIACAGIIFGGTVSCLAVEINKQSKQIKEQYDQIEAQYDKIEAQFNENLVKQSELVVSQSEIYLKNGNVDDAKQLITDTYYSAEGKLPADAKSNLRYMLGEVLRCYDDGSKLNPLHNFTMTSAVKLMDVSGDYKYLAAFDQSNALAIWNLETFEKVYEAYTDFSCMEEFKQNYDFDDEGHFIYLGDNSLVCVDCEKGSMAWSVDVKYANRFISIDDDRFFVISDTDMYIVDRHTGEVLNNRKDELLAGYLVTNKLLLSSDSMSVIAALSNTEATTVVQIDTEDLQIKKSMDVPYDSIIAGISDGEGNIILEGITFTDGFLSSEYEYICFDEKSFEKKFVKHADHFLTRMLLYKGELITYYSGGIMKLNPKDLSLIEECQVDRNITDIIAFNDGRLGLFLTDGKYKVQNVDEFSFYENASYDMEIGDVKSYKYARDYFAVLPLKSNRITLYSIKPSRGAEVCELSEGETIEMDYSGKLEAKATHIEADSEEEYSITVDSSGIHICLGEDEIKTFDVSTEGIRGVNVDQGFKLIVVQYSDYSVEVRDYETYDLLASVVLSYEGYICEMDDNYLVIADDSRGYVINRDNYLPEACVYGYMSYDRDSNMFTVARSSYDNTSYKMPFRSLEELIDLAK